MSGLTEKQAQCFKIIGDGIAASGISPSYREIARKMGLAGIGGVHRMITALEERGRIRRIPNRNRAIEIIARGNERTVTLSPDVYAALLKYARDVDKSVDTIASEVLGEAMGLA